MIIFITEFLFVYASTKVKTWSLIEDSLYFALLDVYVDNSSIY